jgi:hypothetical protein
MLEVCTIVKSCLFVKWHPVCQEKEKEKGNPHIDLDQSIWKHNICSTQQPRYTTFVYV